MTVFRKFLSTNSLSHNFFKRKMSSSKFTNKLANEKSPYLLQHKNNPVNWFPWSDEAFAEAQKLNRPIFLSIGYSTCHWCHVMEHESFENESIAKYLNENFVSIKVDREEMPDVDKYYMQFVQAMSGHGGWPLTAFITPSKQPFLGGTYFPPEDSPYQTGFRSVLKLVSEKWKEDPENTSEHAEYLAKILKETFKTKQFEGQIVAKESINKCFNTLKTSFDEENGGFGVAPKFPEPSNLVFLAQYCVLHKDEKENAELAKKMLYHTLDKMEAGGIHDHVGKGFHRYSVDKVWHVPHFEKMLYDQAQLLEVYSKAQMLGNDYKLVIEGIVSYVKECLTSKEGAFYCAEDADSLPSKDAQKKIEGSFYVWENDEIETLLYNFAPADNENITLDEIFKETFNVKPQGNVEKRQDPHGELTNKNVLLRTKTLEELAKEFKTTVPQFQRSLNDCYEELKKYRDQRPRPHLDNKILTSWNSLMIHGLVYAARALPEHKAEYLELAGKAFDFIVKNMRQEDGSLIRSAYVDEQGNYTKTESVIKAYADDYACFIQACIDLYEIKFDDRYLQLALDSQKVFDEKFFDHEEKSGYFYTSSDSKETFVRTKPEQDGAEPSCNSVAALNLIRLGELLDHKEYKDTAAKIINGAGNLLNKSAHALPLMCTALEKLQSSSTQIIVVGNDENKQECQEMIDLIHSNFIPNQILIYVNNSKKDSLICSLNSHVKELATSFKKATVMICSNYTCNLPIEDLKELEDRLSEL